MKIKKLSPEEIAFVKAAIKRLSASVTADRECLKKAHIEELKWRDDTYYEFLGYIGRSRVAGIVD